MNNGKLTKHQLQEAIMTGNELQVYTPPHRPPLIGKKWMKQGDFGIVFAWRGIGKTWFAFLMMRSLVYGKPLGPWQTHRKSRVLYVDGEMAAEDMKNRAKLLKLIPNENAHFLNHETLWEQCNRDLNLCDFDQQKLLTDSCVDLSIQVLILDNLSALFTGLKEDKADDWDKFVKPWLLNLRRRAITVILICHSGKDRTLRGTSKKEDMVFWTIDLAEMKELSRPPKGIEQCRFVNRFTKTRNAQEVEYEEYLWKLTTKPEMGPMVVEHEEYGQMQRVLTLIRQGYKRCGDIATQLELSDGRVSQIVRELMERGLVGISGRDYVPLFDPLKNV
jgi:hypothetical protein